jgi:hypothetical protein
MAELTAAGTPYDTGIQGATAVLHGPPSFWSYSTLKEIEACPQRYVLSRASYPDLWAGDGYPSRPSPNSLFGEVVHEALDTLVKVLIRAGCESLATPAAVGILKPLGGIPAAVKMAMELRLSTLEANPRLNSEAFQRLARSLGDRSEDARAVVQEFLSRLSFPDAPISADERVTGGSNTTGPPFRRRPATTGTHSEITLVDEELRLIGRIDLLTVGEDDVRILDYKTGAPDPGHVEQVNLYALLWGRDHVVNPHELPVGQLTIAYPNDYVDVGPDERGDVTALQHQLRLRVASADNMADEVLPEARPAPELCRFCPVKGLCGTYWSRIVPNPASVADGEWFDFEGVVGSPNGVRSRWMMASGSGEKQLLLRTPPSAPRLVEGDRVRLLGIRLEEDQEADAIVAVMSTSTEVLTLTR